ncbi:MAG: hypothetical protein RBS80_07535 [Thermoguttaceae bacterium]|jgi:hypothetical protein|nr:hypothetical protein [Thermoguttaceae bacterium]
MTKRNQFRTTILLAGLVAVAMVTGCSRGDGRQRVTGRVTLDGQPLPEGAINFRPAPGVSANSSGGPIKAGRFELPADRGLVPGRYLVTVTAMRETGRMVEDEQMGTIAETAPVVFKEAGSLEATVEAGQRTDFEFTLTTAN